MRWQRPPALPMQYISGGRSGNSPERRRGRGDTTGKADRGFRFCLSLQKGSIRFPVLQIIPQNKCVSFLSFATEETTKNLRLRCSSLDWLIEPWKSTMQTDKFCVVD